MQRLDRTQAGLFPPLLSYSCTPGTERGGFYTHVRCPAVLATADSSTQNPSPRAKPFLAPRAALKTSPRRRRSFSSSKPEEQTETRRQAQAHQKGTDENKPGLAKARKYKKKRARADPASNLIWLCFLSLEAVDTFCPESGPVLITHTH